MNEESLEPITARLGVDIAEERCAGFGFFFSSPFYFLHSIKGNDVLFPICMMPSHHWHSGVVFWLLEWSEGGLPTPGGKL